MPNNDYCDHDCANCSKHCDEAEWDDDDCGCGAGDACSHDDYDDHDDDDDDDDADDDADDD